MSRALALPLLVLSLAVGGFLFVRESATDGPTSAAATQAEAQADTAAAASAFASAQPAVQAWYADHGSYAGLTLAPAFEVAVVRADASSYCLQTGPADAPMHESGPGGQPQRGAC